MLVGVNKVDLSLIPDHVGLLLIDISSGSRDGLWNIGMTVKFSRFPENITDGGLSCGDPVIFLGVSGGTAREE